MKPRPRASNSACTRGPWKTGSMISGIEWERINQRLDMKREMEKSVISHLKDYQENIKFQYIYRLVEAESSSLYETLLDRFQVYGTDFSSIVDMINNKMIDKEQTLKMMKSMALDCNEISAKINDLRERIEAL